MIPNLVPMMLVKLGMICLIASCTVKPPLVDISQLDSTHNQVNVKRVKKYNRETCKMETVPVRSYPLSSSGSVSPSLMGYMCLSPEDMARVMSWGKQECKNLKNSNIEMLGDDQD